MFLAIDSTASLAIWHLLYLGRPRPNCVFGGVAASATVQTFIKSRCTLTVSTHRMAAPARFVKEPSPHRAMRHSDPIEVLGEIS